MSIGQFAIILLGDIMNRLKELRIERGYTQIKMQMLTGIDQSDYSKIECGKRYYSKWKKAKKVAKTPKKYLTENCEVVIIAR